MTVFVDTSALYALLDSNDPAHPDAAAFFARDGRREKLQTTSYVVLESAALVHRRLGSDSVRALLTDLIAPIEVVWVDEETHRAGVRSFLAALSAHASLVDHVSFVVMRSNGIFRAFSYDDDFVRAGFELAQASRGA
ncbi:MAG: PIN domain-containing protein [Chloroflexi bacterium]|nr:MAG: PIN domain-containing protein [Chloroflexota bacterium]